MSSTPVSTGEAFTQTIERAIPNNDGSLSMRASIGAVLRSLGVAYDRAGKGTFRVVAVGAQVSLDTTLSPSDGYEIIG